MMLPKDVQAELQEINQATQKGMLVCPGLVSINGYSMPKEGLIIVGPFATRHLIKMLHQISDGHMGSH